MSQRSHRVAVIRIGMSVLWCAGAAHGFRTGPPAGRTGSPQSLGASCIGCHDAGVAGSVQIIGAPTTYSPNLIYDLTIRVSDAALTGAGFQISVENGAGHVGSLIVSDPVNTQPNGAFVNHTSAGVADSEATWTGSYDYQVQWQAPATDEGTVTFYAAGNAIDGNLFQSGDQAYVTTEEAQFAAIPAASTWGLVVLALTLLTAGTMAAARRPEAAVTAA